MAHLRSPPGGSGNAARMLLDTAERLPGGAAIVGARGVTPYGELAARALRVGGGLRRLGVAPGDRVAIMLPRGHDSAAALFGALASGAAAVVCDEALRARQIDHVLRHSGARLLLTAPGVLGRLPRPPAAPVPTAGVDDLARGGPEDGPGERVGSDAALLLYTSGSTGRPKGVVVSHANLWSGTEAVTGYLGITARDRIASLLPFGFDYGLNQLLCAVGTGAALVVERRPLAQRIAATVREQRVTVLAAVPPLWLELLGAAAFTAAPLPSLRVMTNTGGRLPVPAVRRLRAAQPGAGLVLMYGLTEAFRSTYLPATDVDRKPGSIGRAIPGAEVTVVREDGTPCGPGEVGELVHRGPTVALGYWDDAGATAAVFRPHPLRPPGTPDAERVVFSGDLVRRDADGDLSFVGRRDRMIKTMGRRVSPDEVAEALYASGEVAEAAVGSEPDELRGERIVAYVALAPGGALERLEGYLVRELPRHLRPARIETRRALARTPSGKHDLAATATDHDPA